MPPLALETTVDGAVAVVALGGDLDMSGAGALEAEVERLRAADGLQAVVLDLRALEFLDSSGLRAILKVDMDSRDGGARLVLVRGAEQVQRVFELTRMEERLTFVPDPGAVG
jgi:anti-sigma B factor antagonist